MSSTRSTRPSGSPLPKPIRSVMHPDASLKARDKDKYPDGMHPGLIRGISVEEQRYEFGVDKVVFGVAAALIVGFIAWGVYSPESVSEKAGEAFAWGMEHAGWLFNIVMFVCVLLVAVIALSRMGQIRLGKDDEEPEFGRFSWVAMMFAAGIGVGIFFFGPSEPLQFFLDPPPLTNEAGTETAMHQALAQSNFHWGLNPWAIYSLVGAAIAYSTYRRGRPLLMSSLFAPLMGESNNGTILSRTIDIMAVAATLFGTAASLGIAALQIGEGLGIVTDLEVGNPILLTIIGALTLGFVISAVSGVSKGIRILSNTNITLTFASILFIFLTGPTLLLINLIPSGTLYYFHEFFNMASRSLSWGEETLAFQSEWTAFYWAWWISWAPFVGTFLAKISRGRTLREFILMTVAVPTGILILAFSIFGGTAISFSREGVPGFDGESTPEQVLFSLFDALPLSNFTPYLLIAILAVFFITTADSASVVMGTMSSKGDPESNKMVSIFWGLCMMGVAVVMLLAGGEDALSGLQSLTVLIALPFSLVVLGLLFSFVRDLTTDPHTIRDRYAESALQYAVWHGLEDYGDNFELVIKESRYGDGAGKDFDSSDDKYTSWYERYDEDGNRVGYDYETDTWEDGYTREEVDDRVDEDDPDSDVESETGEQTADSER
ncbi:BCCT family transporter [Corynebacterium sp. CCUG 70398]|nr:BCCT family transporter [Corynebacterium sp. CCUG 70398]